MRRRAMHIKYIALIVIVIDLRSSCQTTNEKCGSEMSFACRTDWGTDNSSAIWVELLTKAFCNSFFQLQMRACHAQGTLHKSKANKTIWPNKLYINWKFAHLCSCTNLLKYFIFGCNLPVLPKRLRINANNASINPFKMCINLEKTLRNADSKKTREPKAIGRKRAWLWVGQNRMENRLLISRNGAAAQRPVLASVAH